MMRIKWRLLYMDRRKRLLVIRQMRILKMVWILIESTKEIILLILCLLREDQLKGLQETHPEMLMIHMSQEFLKIFRILNFLNKLEQKMLYQVTEKFKIEFSMTRETNYLQEAKKQEMHYQKKEHWCLLIQFVYLAINCNLM